MGATTEELEHHPAAREVALADGLASLGPGCSRRHRALPRPPGARQGPDKEGRRQPCWHLGYKAGADEAFLEQQAEVLRDEVTQRTHVPTRPLELAQEG
eukprot:120533-Pyramimonas_sp.AAC.1